jgi:SAM-dependent methyltransferase
MSAVVWHDLECGSYARDLEVWRELAAEHGEPILDVGAGTGRVTLDLARRGHRVTALDRDPELLAALASRAGATTVETAVGDAREFELERRFALIIVPMQTIQLLGGADGRGQFLRRARVHLRSGGAVAVAITDTLELFEISDGATAPLPDICEIHGVVYSSQPTAVRSEGDGFVLERRRETVSTDGSRLVAQDRIHLDAVSAVELEREGAEAGLQAAGVMIVPPTADYVGSQVVVLRG